MHLRDQEWITVSAQFVRSVRGRRSQRAFSARLGYQSKPVADWESGRRAPRALLLLQALQQKGVDVVAAMHAFHPGLPILSCVEHAELCQWLQGLRGSIPVGTLAKRMEVSRYTVGRWLSGQTEIRLPQFFHFVQAVSGRASDLIASMVDIDSIPALADEFARRDRAKRLAHEHPWTPLLLRVLETDDYQELPAHDDQWLASYVGLPVSLVSSNIESLLDLGVVERCDDRLHAVPVTIDTQQSEESNLRIKQHWNAVVRERLPVPRRDDLFSYNVISCSDADLKEIRELMRSTFRRIRSLVEASAPAERVALIQLQLLNWPTQEREEASAQAGTGPTL